MALFQKPIVINMICLICLVSAIPTVTDFMYYNSGTTNSTQKYKLVGVTNIYNEGYQYKNDPLSANDWKVGSPLTYLFETIGNHSNQTLKTPTSGLRSSVFMGPIGQGGFEMRGDGRLTDFTIFNNGPNARPSQFAYKWDLNDAVFGFTFKNKQLQYLSSKIFQTSPIDDRMSEYAIDSLSHSGSYPTTRLMGTDKDFSVINIKSVNVTAFSSFEPLNVNMSSIPATIFWFDIDNSHNIQDITMDFFFNWPDIIKIDTVNMNNNENGFFINKLLNISDDQYYTCGNMSFTMQQCNSNENVNNECNTPIKGYMTYNDSLYANWLSFINQTELNKFDLKPKTTTHMPTIYRHYAWNSKNITIAAKSTYSFAFILSWFFPMRTFNNNTQYLGNYYNNFYGSALKVNDDVIDKMPKIINNILSWQKLWNMSVNEMLPNFLKDIYVNAPGYISRTGYFLESDNNGTGIWRQSESWSCYQISPPHIHQYRALAYNLIFGNVLDRGILNMYSFGQIDNGLVSELFGGNCFGINGKMGEPSGDPRGDDNSLYVLDMYLQFKWYKDGIEYVYDRYKYVKNAMQWIMQHSIPYGYGLPYGLRNTYDETLMGDINTYSSIIYISAIYAMKNMANVFEPNNNTYMNSLNNALKYANGNLSKLLWQSNDGYGFYIGFWCENGIFSPYGLQSDSTYGFLWSLILDLDQYWTDININRFISHLQQEKLRNWSQYGLQFVSNRTTPGFDCKSNQFLGTFNDFDTWEMATIDHAAIALYLNKSFDILNKSISSLNYSLFISETGLNKYRELFNDQWDWRDISSTYNDSDPEYSRPVVNSHYCRQLIHYSIIFAANGQNLYFDSSTNQIILELKP
eukprot:62837_1